jgi:hypothetical protein
VDLGTTAQPGGNTLIVNGTGQLVQNATPDPIPAAGNTFEANGTPLPAPNLSFTTLTTSLNPVQAGRPVTFTATIRANTSGSGAPAGSVHFVDTTTNADLGTVPLTASSAALTTSALLAGNHVIVANYLGDGTFLPSLDTLTETAINSAPVVQPITGPSSAIPGQPLALAVVITDANPPDTHTATWIWGDSTTSTGTVSEANGTGTASGSHAYAAVGTYTVTATVTDNGNLSASRTFSVTVADAIYILNLTASGALTVSGNANLNLPGPITVDSGSSSALVASGNASITASQINVAGGAGRSGNAALNPAATTHASVVPDAFAALPIPSNGTAQGTVSLSGNQSLTINPGKYAQISVSGNAHLTMNPGVYVLAGGGFTATGNASVNGTGVLIYNAGSNFPNPGGNFGGVTLSGNGAIQLSPPADGPYKGIVLFQARDNTRALSLSGNGVLGVAGSIYAVVGTVALSGNANLHSALVVNQMTVSGNATSTLSVDGAGAVSNTAGTLLAGNLLVYVDNRNGLFTSDELARIHDAVSAINGMLTRMART